MIDPLEVIEKLEQGGHKGLTYPEQLFIVEVFKAAAKTQNEELMKVVLMIQISISGLINAIQIYFVSEITDLKELLVVFVGLMVID